jgi:hypothetical protein
MSQNLHKRRSSELWLQCTSPGGNSKSLMSTVVLLFAQVHAKDAEM